MKLASLVPAMLVIALAFAMGPLVGGVTAQPDPAEVLCPITIPELLAKHCIIVTGEGCVIVHVTTFGVPGDPDVFVNTCPT